MIADFQVSLALQALRERRKYSARDLSLSAGLPADEVSRIEAGKIGLGYFTAARLSQVLQVSLADIALTAHARDPDMVRRRYEELAIHASPR
jgi:transcriptional regulator with XRE-family HTH domain